MYLSKKQNIFFIEIFLFLVYIFFILLGFKDFIIWSQITDHLTFDYISNNENIIHLYEINHPHLLRVFILYLIYQFSLFFNLDINIIFNLVIISLLFISYTLLKKIITDFNNDLKYSILVILLTLFLLSIFMNGRIVFAIFGNTLLLYSIYVKSCSLKNNISTIHFFVLVLISILFTSVSSGTFMVSVLTLLIFYFTIIIIHLPKLKIKYIYLQIYLILVLILLSPLIIKFINKNLKFFNGSIIEMLEHGFGRYFGEYYILFFILLFFIPFIVVFLFVYFRKKNFYILPFSMILSSTIIGMFGLLSFFSGISAFILWVYFLLRKEKKIVKKNIN
jgi:hypothetical protein